jgi:hypothetical protein
MGVPVDQCRVIVEEVHAHDAINVGDAAP